MVVIGLDYIPSIGCHSSVSLSHTPTSGNHLENQLSALKSSFQDWPLVGPMPFIISSYKSNSLPRDLSLADHTPIHFVIWFRKPGVSHRISSIIIPVDSMSWVPLDSSSNPSSLLTLPWFQVDHCHSLSHLISMLPTLPLSDQHFTPTIRVIIPQPKSFLVTHTLASSPSMTPHWLQKAPLQDRPGNLK